MVVEIEDKYFSNNSGVDYWGETPATVMTISRAILDHDSLNPVLFKWKIKKPQHRSTAIWLFHITHQFSPVSKVLLLSPSFFSTASSSTTVCSRSADTESCREWVMVLLLNVYWVKAPIIHIEEIVLSQSDAAFLKKTKNHSASHALGTVRLRYANCHFIFIM